MKTRIIGNAAAMSATDHFGIHDAGSIILLFPRTGEALDWVFDNLPDDAIRFGHAIAIEARCFPPIWDAIVGEFGEPDGEGDLASDTAR